MAMMSWAEEWLPRTAALAREAELFVRIIIVALSTRVGHDNHDGLDWSPLAGSTASGCSDSSQSREAIATATVSPGQALAEMARRWPAKEGGGGEGGGGRQVRAAGTPHRRLRCLEPLTLCGMVSKPNQNSIPPTPTIPMSRTRASPFAYVSNQRHALWRVLIHQPCPRLETCLRAIWRDTMVSMR